MKQITSLLILIFSISLYGQLKLIDELPQKNGDVFFSYVIELGGDKLFYEETKNAYYNVEEYTDGSKRRDKFPK